MKTLLCGFFVCLLINTVDAGRWVPSNSLDSVADIPPLMVRTERIDEKVMEFIYSVPAPKIIPAGNDTAGDKNTVEMIRVGNAPCRGNPGKPVLPVIPLRVMLPAGRDLESVEVLAAEKIPLPGKHLVKHGQRPYPILSEVVAEYTEHDATVYESDDPYPDTLYEKIGVQRKRGVSVLLINLNPVVYLPRSGTLSYYRRLRVRLHLKPGASKAPALVYRPDATGLMLKGIDNQELIESYTTMVKSNTFLDVGLCNPADSYQYVVVTSEAIRDAATTPSLSDFIAHKQSRGVSATVVTIADILSEYPGLDDQEKLRNFITDAYNNWETDFVLLGGDTNIIPMRKLWSQCSGCPAGSLSSTYTAEIPSDLYYQCLDGTYNYDEDDLWGEPDDGPGGTDVDLMAEVYIGRASAEDADEMSNFIYKTMAYENEDPGAVYLGNALMVGEYLGFGGVAQYAKDSKEEVRLGSSEHGYSTSGFASYPWVTVSTLYNKDAYWPASEIIAKINSNSFGIFNHFGHANTSMVMKMYTPQADSLLNEKFLFVYSQGCLPGNFESDCIAEHLTTSTRHGCFAVVMNSRYGWGEYNSTDGPSQRFDRQFFDAYFGENITHCGALNADSHEDNLWGISEPCIRWSYYETNLLGDPETELRVAQDVDDDGIDNDEDNCPLVYNPGQENNDGDAPGNVCDNCPDEVNPDQEDADGDGIGDVCDECMDTDGDGYGNPGFPDNICDEDNCPSTPNGPDLGTCAEHLGVIYKGTGVTCTLDAECESGEICQMNQEDCNDNGMGDACECYADFDSDGNAYPSDLTVFLGEYGRTDCLINPPCEADMDGDGNVYPRDLSIFLEEYGRTDCPVLE